MWNNSTLLLCRVESSRCSLNISLCLIPGSEFYWAIVIHKHTYRRNKGDGAAGVEEVVDAAAGRAKALFGKLVAQMRTRPIRRHCFFLASPPFYAARHVVLSFWGCCEVQVVRVFRKKKR